MGLADFWVIFGAFLGGFSGILRKFGEKRGSWLWDLFSSMFNSQVEKLCLWKCGVE